MLAYDRDLRRFLEWLGSRRIEGLTISDLSGYPAWLTQQELAPASISRHVVSLKVFFRYLQLESVLTRESGRAARHAETLAARADGALAGRNRRAAHRAQAAAAVAAARPGDARVALRDRLPRVGAFDAASRATCISTSATASATARATSSASCRWAKRRSRRCEDYLRTRAAEAGRARRRRRRSFCCSLARRPAAPRADLGTDQALREADRLLARPEPALTAPQLRHASAGRRRRPAASARNARPRQHRHDADLHARRPLAAQEGPRGVSSAGMM